MPLTYGMAGDVSPAADPQSRHNHQGQFGGVSWWRRGGWFSAPLLANQMFRNVFLHRLRELCETKFNEKAFAAFAPLIDDLQKKLEPEVRIRAAIRGEGEATALASFHTNIVSFRHQAENRRKFIPAELDRSKSVPPQD